MKNVEKLALVAVGLYFVAMAANYVVPFFLVTFKEAGWFPTNIALLSAPLVAVSLSVHIAIAIWLYRVAKREGDAPWVWALFGLIFSVSGAVLFYAVRIYEKMNRQGNPGETAHEPTCPPAP